MGILALIRNAFRGGIKRDDKPPAELPVQMTKEEVDAFLAERVLAKKEPLDVKRSVVDLLKALDLDSSLPARRELALELGYQGPMTEDNAVMNDALHALLMQDLYTHKFKCD